MSEYFNIHEVMGATKLLHHLDRLAEWKATGNTKPIHVGLDLTNTCNHRCPQCNGYMGQDNTTISFADLERIIPQFAAGGVKAVGLGGGGDPSCHPQLAQTIRLIHGHGMDLGMITNGQVLRQEVLDALVEYGSWVRISLDADSPELFAKTHGVKGEAFQKVQDNLRHLVVQTQATGGKLIVGTSFLIGPHTMQAIYGSARIARDLGVAYIRMRPYFTWGGDRPFSQQEAERVLVELERCKELETESFKVSYPADRTSWAKDDILEPNPPGCHMHHFSTIVEADMSMYLCCHTKGMKKYAIGNLKEQSFDEIWNSAHRRHVYENIDYRDCALPCREAANNRLLIGLLQDVTHVNFLS